jgi:hypothetical protein
MADKLAAHIPYERQQDPMSNRMCGPAALCMVYRSFGIDCSQAELAPKVTRSGPLGNEGARTYLLAQDALARGLSAIVFRARDPLRTLRACQNRPLRLILNHRLRLQSPIGHFTVSVRVGDEHVVVHDPQVGPNTRIDQMDLLKLWRPLGRDSEIVGNVLVAFAQGRQPAAPCPKCGSTIPDTIACPGCCQPVPLQPATVLGCMNVSCSERAWETLFCPYCDADLMAAPAKDSSRAPAAPPAATDEAEKIQSLNQEIDKFLALLLAANNGRPVRGMESQFKQIRELQNELRDLPKKEAARRQAQAAQAPPTLPPTPAPPPGSDAAKSPERQPVDWNALGLTLLKDLGLIGADRFQLKHSRHSRQGPHETPGTLEARELQKKRGTWK